MLEWCPREQSHAVANADVYKKAVEMKEKLQRMGDNQNRRIDREQHEAQALGSLPPHPNRVVLYQYGQQDGASYMAMELVHGQSLVEVMGGGLSVDQIISYTRQIALALEDVHASGIVHRDLKPENIIVTRSLLGDEQLKLIDFGIARSPVRVAEADEDEEREILGTVLFMAPELLLDGIQDPRTDIYALGVVLFEMITGQGPFDHLIDVNDQSLDAEVFSCLSKKSS